MSLERLELHGVLRLPTCFELSDLVMLIDLKVVIVSFQESDANMTKQLALLAHKLGVQRPEVHFSMNCDDAMGMNGDYRRALQIM